MDSYAKRRTANGTIGPEDNTVSFTPPADLELRGNAGQALVKWRRKPDGNICIESFDGVSLGDSQEGDYEEQESDPYNTGEMDEEDEGDQGT